MKKLTQLTFSAIAVFCFMASANAQQAVENTQNSAKAKNVILLISDGAGMQTWNAASYYRHGTLGKEVYDKFEVKLFASTHSLNTSKQATKTADGTIKFDSAKLWGNHKSSNIFKGGLGNYDGYFDGYEYARTDATDSAAAATALASGYKTYNNAINWSNDDERLKHIGEYIVESGRSLGVVSSVQWSHATPAGFLAHNPSRNNYAEIGKEIVDSGLATVVMGAGHPYFDENGKSIEPKDDKAFHFVGGKETWEKLISGQTDYHFIEKKEDFIALAEKRLDLGSKSKVLGTTQTASTLQFSRKGQSSGNLLDNQPDLPTMTKGALNLVSQNPNGFFLMVEGGAVDWAAHANNLPRIIEEQIDFNLAVEAVVEWVEKNSSWEETLVIVTTDHGNGLLAGPDSDMNPYSPIINQGAGALPLVRWHTDNHTRELVPVYAKGVGADFFHSVARKEPNLGRVYKAEENSRKYIDNTQIFDAATNALGIETSKSKQ
ncbi:alkaline phosphatase [Mannheimia varigena]|uniref:alkaline phosphatase n=1 Tax=Mannheimia varigena TaxID=85404 RepID=UPI000DBF19C9|nr:alkaline phosphatase [Mannheimia varigena]AWW33603.1 alkaline phosphatase [Mannheimia varigena]